MAEPARKRASYADVLSTPSNVVAEVIDGVLYTHARPRIGHARAAARMSRELAGFDDEGEGPGGWIILVEPELHLGPEPDIVVPDIVGWRRERMPALPLEAPYLTLAPDWVCEIASPSTKAIDRADKMPIYARERVSHVWLLDSDARLLEVYELDAGRWVMAQVFRGDGAVRGRPFEAQELRLGSLWTP